MNKAAFHILLLRHGATAANHEKRYAGSTDVSLSDEGIAALRTLQSSGLYPDISGYALYTSNLLRAKETLAILFPGSAAAALSSFNEMDFGAFEMHSYEDLKDRAEYRLWVEDTTGNVSCPMGESANHFRRRVAEGMEKLMAQRENALVITHGGVIAQIMQALFPHENKHFYQWQPANGCGYLIRFSGGTAASYRPIDNFSDRKESSL